MLWLLEHDPVVTTGRRIPADLPDPAALSRVGARLVSTERGGLLTWHGPGQLVAYVLIDAHSRRLRVKEVVCRLEAGVIAWLGDQGVVSGRRTSFPGIWVGSDKICAIGLHFMRGVSMHGIALNLDPAPWGFDLILPCGIRDGGVTSLARLAGWAPGPEEAAASLAARLTEALVAGSCAGD